MDFNIFLRMFKNSIMEGITLAAKDGSIREVLNSAHVIARAMKGDDNLWDRVVPVLPCRCCESLPPNKYGLEPRKCLKFSLGSMGYLLGLDHVLDFTGCLDEKGK